MTHQLLKIIYNTWRQVQVLRMIKKTSVILSQVKKKLQTFYFTFCARGYHRPQRPLWPPRGSPLVPPVMHFCTACFLLWDPGRLVRPSADPSGARPPLCRAVQPVADRTATAAAGPVYNKGRYVCQSLAIGADNLTYKYGPSYEQMCWGLSLGFPLFTLYPFLIPKPS